MRQWGRCYRVQFGNMSMFEHIKKIMGFVDRKARVCSVWYI